MTASIPVLIERMQNSARWLQTHADAQRHHLLAFTTSVLELVDALDTQIQKTREKPDA